MKPTALVTPLAAAALSALQPFSPSALCSDAPRPNTARPNILWLVAEDFTYNYAGAYGDPLARTPNFDRLAARGILYENAHSTAPVCAPARSSIITGCYASSLGTQNMRSQRPLPAGVRFFPEFLRDAGYYCTNNAKTDYNTSTRWMPAAWDACDKNAHWRNRNPGQPFFAVFNCELSHEGKLFKRVPLDTDPARVKLPAYLPDTKETRDDTAQYYDCATRADAFLGKILDQLKADGLADDTIVFFYSDNGGCTPRSKRFLYDNGTHIALAIYFPEKYKHLAPAAPGSRVRDPVNFVDLAPTVLSLAGLPPAPQFQGRALAGPNRPAPADTPRYTYLLRNRMDEVYDFSRAVTDGRYRYIRNYMPHLPNGQHLNYLWNLASMKKWDALYRAAPEKLPPAQRAFFEPKPAEELFDDETDPDNVNNLAADPAHREKLLELRAANRDHMLAIRDTGFFPEPMMISLAAARSPRDLAASDKTYPLEKLLDLADAMQLAPPSTQSPRSPESGVQSPLPVVRYWSIEAALAQPTYAADCAPLLDDPDPSVRTAAAEFILRHDAANDPAWRALSALLAPAQTRETRLLALNALANLPPPPPAVRAQLAAIAAESSAKSGEYLPNIANYLMDKFQIPKTGTADKTQTQPKKSKNTKKRQ